MRLGRLGIRGPQVQRDLVMEQGTLALRGLWVLLVSLVRLVTPDRRGLRVSLALLGLVGRLGLPDSQVKLE